MRIKHLLPLLLLLFGCTARERDHPVKIIWINDKAVEIELTNPGFVNLPVEKLSASLKVELGDSGQPMLGQFFRRNNKIVFQPVVPFTRGMHYHILANDIIFSEVDIPLDENALPPELNIYPSSDTVPENILKLYLRFSESMVEGKSMRYIHLINTEGDTLDGTFLDLQPELWNVDGTILTLWFDPGRVKRDLIPNQRMGNPIIKNNRYTLVVNGEWKSKSGREIGKKTAKIFFVQDRDEASPNINSWILDVPPVGSKDKMRINFTEVLDYSLIQSAIRIFNKNGEMVIGAYTVHQNERAINFLPDVKWQRGIYTIRVESRLEDLAGNNLNRLFDRDLTKSDSPIEAKYLERTFVIN